MATTAEYLEFVMDQMPSGIGEFRARKMFGEYMIYCNDKPVLTVCDNAVFVKKLPELSELMRNAPCGFPYEGAKEAYLLDIEDRALTVAVIEILERVTPLPKKRAKKRI